MKQLQEKTHTSEGEKKKINKATHRHGTGVFPRAPGPGAGRDQGLSPGPLLCPSGSDQSGAPASGPGESPSLQGPPAWPEISGGRPASLSRRQGARAPAQRTLPNLVTLRRARRSPKPGAARPPRVRMGPRGGGAWNGRSRRDCGLASVMQPLCPRPWLPPAPPPPPPTRAEKLDWTRLGWSHSPGAPVPAQDSGLPGKVSAFPCQAPAEETRMAFLPLAVVGAG
jgi:hypothetical protein